MGQCGSVAPLSEREKGLIANSWAKVKTEPKDNGVAILVEFFKRHPDYQKFFEPFAHVPSSQLATHPLVIAHALAIVYAISSMVSAIDEPEVIDAVVDKHLKTHHPRGVKLAHYQDLESVVASALKPLLNEEGNKAWLHAFDCFNAKIQNYRG